MTDLAPVRPMTLVMEDDPALQILRVTNIGKKPWSDKFQNRRYSAEPGQEIVVPFLAVCLWLGHPDAIDHPSDKQRQFRFEEWRRLQVRYGCYDNIGDETIHTKQGDIPAWKNVVPRLKVTTMAGEEVITVVDDPEGRHLLPAQQNISQVEMMQNAIERMQAQMEEMQARLDQAQRTEEAIGEAADSPTPPVRDESRPPTTGIPSSIPEAPPAVTQDVTVDGPGDRPRVTE